VQARLKTHRRALSLALTSNLNPAGQHQSGSSATTDGSKLTFIGLLVKLQLQQQAPRKERLQERRGWFTHIAHTHHIQLQLQQLVQAKGKDHASIQAGSIKVVHNLNHQAEI